MNADDEHPTEPFRVVWGYLGPIRYGEVPSFRRVKGMPRLYTVVEGVEDEAALDGIRTFAADLVQWLPPGSTDDRG